MIYKWKPSSRIKADANIVGAELQRIANENGGTLVPTIIVDRARPQAAPLHDLFEWNDSIAAESYRQDQARYVMRQITVVIEKDGQLHEMRAFVNLEVDTLESAGGKENKYLSTVVVLSTPDYREQLLCKALKEIEWWERRYQEFVELAPVFATVRAVRDLAAAG